LPAASATTGRSPAGSAGDEPARWCRINAQTLTLTAGRGGVAGGGGGTRGRSTHGAKVGAAGGMEGLWGGLEGLAALLGAVVVMASRVSATPMMRAMSGICGAVRP